jgi:gamma-glutamylcyclotransferase (GGCT)/AIG2-like uncharacterized protein YtfP
MNLFTYGSLMFPEVWERVTGLCGAGQPASLADHAARRIRGQTYPALVTGVGESTEGVLYADVTPEAVARLDAFEGPFYERVMVGVSLGDGAATRAWVYRAALPDDPDILAECWDPERFQREHLGRFLQDDPGFSATGR